MQQILFIGWVVTDYCNSFLMQVADVLNANRKLELIPINNISDCITAYPVLWHVSHMFIC